MTLPLAAARNWIPAFAGMTAPLDGTAWKLQNLNRKKPEKQRRNEREISSIAPNLHGI
ncbi:MAG: hypothetical protein ABTQ34_04495 [Bdellovibrionales bacterium]